MGRIDDVWKNRGVQSAALAVRTFHTLIVISAHASGTRVTGLSPVFVLLILTVCFFCVRFVSF